MKLQQQHANKIESIFHADIKEILGECTVFRLKPKYSQICHTLSSFYFEIRSELMSK